MLSNPSLLNLYLQTTRKVFFVVSHISPSHQISHRSPFTPIPHKRDLHLRKPTTMASKSFHDAHGGTYDRMASGCTRTVAEKFLPELDPPITKDSYILDNACGTGIVTRLIKAQDPSARIMCADLAPGVLDVVKTHVRENHWENVDTTVLDVRDLKTLEDDTFSHVITNFGFSPTPDDHDGPKKAAAEMYRVLKKGGVCVVTTWAGTCISVLHFLLKRYINTSSQSATSTSPWKPQHLGSVPMRSPTSGTFPAVGTADHGSSASSRMPGSDTMSLSRAWTRRSWQPIWMGSSLT